jgi:hypothetical protein
LKTPASHNGTGAVNNLSDDVLTLKLSFAGGVMVHFFKVLPTVRFKRVASAFAQVCGKSLDAIRFAWEGDRISDHDKTINELGLIDGDCVDVWELQIGD